jgi:kynureninase
MLRNIGNFTLFSTSMAATTDLGSLLISNPDQFMTELTKRADPLSREMAEELDRIDPLCYTADEFKHGDVIPFAGHSLGPLFKPAAAAIQKTLEIQATQLHGGHFKASHPDGKDDAEWFDCDRNKPALRAAQKILGFADDCEFNFTANGLSDNLGRIMDTLYDPVPGKTKIVMLATEFFSDQAIVRSVIKRAFKSKTVNPEAHIVKLSPDENGLYSSDNIISAIQAEAENSQLICLSDIVFSTGQRLDLQTIFSALKETIEKNNIIVGLDLAHTVGNRTIDLENMPVRISFAVGCAYKHICGSAGSGFGIYINRHVDLEANPPLQGWKAAASNRVFAILNDYDDSIMMRHGALAFRTSNPPPLNLHAVQTYLCYFDQIGFDKCLNKSESLVRYLIMQLKQQLGDKIQLITPEDPKQRGAMVVLQVKGVTDVKSIEKQLSEASPSLGLFEVDVRPPNNIRITAHYGYTKFTQIHQLVTKLELILANRLENRAGFCRNLTNNLS